MLIDNSHLPTSAIVQVIGLPVVKGEKYAWSGNGLRKPDGGAGVVGGGAVEASETGFAFNCAFISANSFSSAVTRGSTGAGAGVRAGVGFGAGAGTGLGLSACDAIE